MKELRLPEQNSVFLVGRLTRDAEVRYTAKGQPVGNFDIAVNRRYLDNATNEWKDDVSYVKIVVWGKAAERTGERGKKGTAVHVNGRLKSRSWETKDGQKRAALEVVANRVQYLSRQDSVSSTDAQNTGAEEGESGVAVGAGVEEVPF